jgi:hypothetical protein
MECELKMSMRGMERESKTTSSISEDDEDEEEEMRRRFKSCEE